MSKQLPPPNIYEEPPWSKAPSQDSNFLLEVLKQGMIVDTIKLTTKAYFTIGRQHGLVDIPMDHQSISRLHAVLNFRDDGALMLRDLGSTQGTFLNKKACEKDTYHRCYVGDMIKFGASTRQYIVCGPEEQRPEEYNSVNLEMLREKLAERTAAVEKRAEETADRESFSWGMREDAVELTEQENVEKDETEIPEYLKNMRNDENFDRKFGGKFSVNINDDEAKNSKDAEIMEKIRKKERKVQNMQEEIRRIYLKENTQADGLTQGQRQAVDRNDKAIAQSKEEIDALVAQIRAKRVDREGKGTGTSADGIVGNVAGHNKRRKNSADEDEDNVLDRSKETADVTTNWRLRKKMQKVNHSAAPLSAGDSTMGINSSGTTTNDGHALSYVEIKEQLTKQVSLRDQRQLELNALTERITLEEQALNTHSSHNANKDRTSSSSSSNDGDDKRNNNNNNNDNMLIPVVVSDDLDMVMLKDTLAEHKGKLRQLENEISMITPSVTKLEKLLKLATPALTSLVCSNSSTGSTSSSREAAGSAGNNKSAMDTRDMDQQVLLAEDNQATSAVDVPATTLKLAPLPDAVPTNIAKTTIKPPIIRSTAAAAAAAAAGGGSSSRSELPSVSVSGSGTTGAGDNLKSLQRFIEQEKAAELLEEQKKHKEAQKQREHLTHTAESDTSSSTNDTRSIKVQPLPPSPSSEAGNNTSSSTYRASSENSSSTVTLPAVHASMDTTAINMNSGGDMMMLEGGEHVWVPPARQTGDGKTSLNAKYGY